VFPGASHATPLILRGLVSPNVWDLLHALTQYENNRVLHGGQTRSEEHLYTVDHEC